MSAERRGSLARRSADSQTGEASQHLSLVGRKPVHEGFIVEFSGAFRVAQSRADREAFLTPPGGVPARDFAIAATASGAHSGAARASFVPERARAAGEFAAARARDCSTSCSRCRIRACCSGGRLRKRALLLEEFLLLLGSHPLQALDPSGRQSGPHLRRGPLHGRPSFRHARTRLFGQRDSLPAGKRQCQQRHPELTESPHELGSSLILAGSLHLIRRLRLRDLLHRQFRERVETRHHIVIFQYR